MRERLPAAEGFDLARFTGTWHILVTNYGFWRARTHPTVTYERMEDPRRVLLRDTLRFRKKPLLGGAPREAILAGVDVEEEGCKGAFLWRGDGLLRIIASPWCVVMVDPAYEWAVTYFARSNVGTAAGMDVYARAPSLRSEQMAEILAEVRRHPFLGSRSRGLYATVQDGGGTYALD